MKKDIRVAQSGARTTSEGFTFEMETNTRYTAIQELAKLMDKLRIPYVMRPCYDGWEIIYPTVADVIMDAVSHMMVNHARNLIEVMGPDRYYDEGCTGPVYSELTAAQAIEHFYIHYRLNRRNVDKLLPPKPIKAEFYDIERREYVTQEQLRKEYEEVEASDPRGLTFGQYIRNCLTSNNGTLMYT